MSQKIRIKLKSYDHNLVDKSAEKIVKTVKGTGAVVSGPVPLPTQKKIFTVNRSTFVNKKAREQFQLCTFKRILDIYSSTPKTIDALMKLELPSGVEDQSVMEGSVGASRVRGVSGSTDERPKRTNILLTKGRGLKGRLRPDTVRDRSLSSGLSSIIKQSRQNVRTNWKKNRNDFRFQCRG